MLDGTMTGMPRVGETVRLWGLIYAPFRHTTSAGEWLYQMYRLEENMRVEMWLAGEDSRVLCSPFFEKTSVVGLQYHKRGQTKTVNKQAGLE